MRLLHGARRAPRSENAKEQSSEASRLPADVTTDQTVELPDRTLRFKATAGSIPINNGEGKLQAEIAYIAYVRADAEAASRPLTFVFNGGPGASSAYMQLGAIGPWRLPLDNITPSSTPRVIPNPDTWLDFTDLVFVDPVGTGYSRFINTSDEVRKQFWSVDGDIDVLATFMRKWIEKAGRQASRNSSRAKAMAASARRSSPRKLNEQGVAVSGLVMVSAVLDFGWRGNGRQSPLDWVVRLPSMAAAMREGKSPFDREALRDVERYAAGDYLHDLLRGERDSAAVERISARVAQLTGLDPALVRRLAGRVDTRTFLRERNRDRGLVSSMYDATVTGDRSGPGRRRNRTMTTRCSSVIRARAAPWSITPARKASAWTRLPISRPCMSVIATTSVSIRPSPTIASSSRRRGCLAWPWSSLLMPYS